MSKWTLAVPGIDLTPFIPAGVDNPHAWAAQYVFDLLNDLHCKKLMQRTKAETEKDPAVKEALVRVLEADLKVTQYMTESMKLVEEKP